MILTDFSSLTLSSSDNQVEKSNTSHEKNQQEALRESSVVREVFSQEGEKSLPLSLSQNVTFKPSGDQTSLIHEISQPVILCDSILKSILEPKYIKRCFKQIEEDTAQWLERKEPICLPYHDGCCLFTNIPCLEETAVIHHHLHLEKLFREQNLFLHANHVLIENLHFYAMQYPILTDAFWTLCFDNASIIVDLTNIQDMKKSDLCYYAPFHNQEFNTETFRIFCHQKADLKNLTMAHQYDYTITNKKTLETRQISRLHFEGWKDGGGLFEDLGKLVSYLSNYHDSNLFPIIHCRAGVGRTGTLIMACAFEQYIKQNPLRIELLHSTLARLIHCVRHQRGPCCVQTVEQYGALVEFCYHQLIAKDSLP